MTKWEMPEWMKPYQDLFSETSDPEKTMSGYNTAASDLLGTEEGRAVATNAQVGLLVTLHTSGLLKETSACSLEKSHDEKSGV